MKKSLTASLTLAAISLASTTFGQVTVNVSGPVIGKDDTNIGNPEQVFNQGGTLIDHPFHFAFVDIYAGLTGAESFDFDTGQELSLGFNPINSVVYGSDPAAPTGEGYWSGLIDVNHGLSGILGVSESSKIGFAFRGFTLNVNSATDYVIDTTTNVETRIYRNGEVGIFDLSDNSLIYTQLGLTATIFTDWDGGDTGVTPFDTDSEVGDIDVSIEGWSGVISSYYSDSASPVQVDGGTALGDYAVFDGTGQVTVVPEPNTIFGVAAALAAVFVYRRKKA